MNEQASSATLTEADYVAASKAQSTRKEYGKDLHYFLEADSSNCIPATLPRSLLPNAGITPK